MLNEIREYELYLKKDYGGLYKRDNVKNNLSGLRAILTCLARGFLDLLKQLDVTDWSQKDSLTQEFLICWLTGKYELCDNLDSKIIDEFKKAKECCLLDHIINGEMKIRCLPDASRKTVSNFLESKVASWKKSMFFSTKENSVNEIYFKGIIADALQKGPLKNSVMIIKQNGDNFGITTTEEGFKNIKNLFAVIAICLQNLPSGQKSTVIKMAQLSNALNKPTNVKKIRDSLLSAINGYVDSDIYTYNSKPIVSKTEIVGGVVKLFLNQEWLKDYDVKLIDFNDSIDCGYEIFTDKELFQNS